MRNVAAGILIPMLSSRTRYHCKLYLKDDTVGGMTKPMLSSRTRYHRESVISHNIPRWSGHGNAVPRQTVSGIDQRTPSRTTLRHGILQTVRQSSAHGCSCRGKELSLPLPQQHPIDNTDQRDAQVNETLNPLTFIAHCQRINAECLSQLHQQR